MQIHVRTDSHVAGNAKLTHHVATVVMNALGRFRKRITRVEVYFSDENSSQKFGDDDKRCVMEARLAGLHPVAVSHQSSSLEYALDNAADKLAKSLGRTLARRDDPKGRTSYAGDRSVRPGAHDVDSVHSAQG